MPTFCSRQAQKATGRKASGVEGAVRIRYNGSFFFSFLPFLVGMGNGLGWTKSEIGLQVKSGSEKLTVMVLRVAHAAVLVTIVSLVSSKRGLGDPGGRKN